MAIAAILRRDHHWSGNFLQDGGEEIYRNGTEGSNPACSSCESENFRSRARVRASLDRGAQSDRAWPHSSRRHAAPRARAASASSTTAERDGIPNQLLVEHVEQTKVPRTAHARSPRWAPVGRSPLRGSRRRGSVCGPKCGCARQSLGDGCASGGTRELALRGLTPPKTHGSPSR
jgi:hypothetical protein